ncbi:hypothetical protein OG874_44140 [Nocardia sp. NBC_00565]|uniref:hypothetical protein n=1 Tax=Nocardia sp. NBC_00565 TaxID=2975993 RepID=UPI002E80B6E6|nr:hypothetical protein [Nocardia sp. NBC_00565]WUC03557.1 hypothetical protein OG874_44140 [Nocardia sp. NBC_00565]
MANPQHLTNPEALYQAVAERRLQYENLLWQVPAVSLTAQAFLFSVALTQDIDSFPQILAGLLAMTVSVISIMLMASHRRAESRDAQWLERFEQQELGAGAWGAHGAAFRSQKIADPDAGWFANLINLRLMFQVWVVGLGMFGLVAILMIVKTVIIIAVS